MNREWIGDSNEAMGILRVSSHRQKDNISHETQEREIADYCAANGLSLVRVERITESARDSDSRKKYSAAMAHALTNGIRHILFYMYDREARNLTDNEKNEKLVKAGIVVLHYVRDRKVLHRDSSDSDFFIRDVQAAANKQYSRSLSVKINDAMRQKAESGWFPSNNVPLGYALTRKKDESGVENRRGTAYVIRDPDERKVKWVTMEFELRAQGLSYHEILRQVSASGLLTPEEQKGYFHGAIEYRIKNPFYEGYFLWKGIRYKGKHELIIPPKVLKAAREHRGAMKRIDGNLEHGVFAGGWIRCAECGCHITYDPKTKHYRNKTSTTFHYYRCSNGRKAHGKKRYISEAVLWLGFEQIIDEISLTPALAKRIADGLNQTERRRAQESLGKIEGLEAELKMLNQKEDRAYDDMLAGVLDQLAFKRQRDRIRNERIRLTDELERSKAAVNGNFLENAHSIIELATNAKSLFLTRTPGEKRKFLESVVSNLRLNGSTIEYDLTSAWGALVDARRDNEMVVPSVQLSNQESEENWDVEEL